MHVHSSTHLWPDCICVWIVYALSIYSDPHLCVYYKIFQHNHYCFIYILDPPDIDEGSYVPRPSIITRGNKTVNIGTPVYVHTGYDVIIDCNIVNGTPPITIQWFRNGSLDSTRGNVSTITITNANNGDVFKCRANNIMGFDSENTVIYESGKYVHAYIVCVCVMCVVCLRELWYAGCMYIQ